VGFCLLIEQVIKNDQEIQRDNCLMAGDNEQMRYKLERKGTAVGVGWFSCIPERGLNFKKAFEYISKHPNDQFMHKYLLELAAKLDPEKLKSLIQEGQKKGNLHLLAIMYETCILNVRYHHLIKAFEAVDIRELAQNTPLIYIPWSMVKNTDKIIYWLRQFSRNANMHCPLPSSEEMEFPMPFDREAIKQWENSIVTIQEISSPRITSKAISHGTASKETAKKITKKLEYLGILTGWETRPDTTISPYAIERPWILDVTVRNGRNHWQLTGNPISYGRGLNIHQGRVSCVMEAVERHSAFASFDSGLALGYKNDYALIKAKHEDLIKKGFEALDPNDMCLEIPYQNDELHWVLAEQMDQKGSHPIYVPAQIVFLFSNLDEISITSGLPSNGLAAGRTIQEARLGSLLEVIERDAEKVVPYSGDNCFLLESEDQKVSEIIDRCKQKGIQIQFLDITSEFGIPCYKAFIQGPGGIILKGSGAHLDGKRAALAAMTEIPYPYPFWFGSTPAAEGVSLLEFEALPNYSSGDTAQDLQLLEKLLIKNGYSPIYIDLTREDLDIPVVKCLVPGLEIMTVLDRFSPLNIRQFGHYLKAYN
jgi:ribosomal protein S12 methylthiotransferase accessory factor